MDLDRVHMNINLDMVGRAGDGSLQVLAAGSAAVFASWLAEAGPEAGLELDVSLSNSGVGGSDHQTFLKREIPALHLFSGLHDDYHRPSDDAPGFEADGAVRVVDLCAELVERAQREDELAFVELVAEESGAGPRRGRWSVWFGTVPEYGYDGEGLLLGGTSPGSPAEAAGLMKGDVILQVGDVQVEDIYAFMYALQIYKPGDVVLTRYRRGEQEEEVRVTLSTRAREMSAGRRLGP